MTPAAHASPAPPADTRPRLFPAPLTLAGGRIVIDPPLVLAPMEGVTHRVFRDLILDVGGIGAAWTEFLSVPQVPLSVEAIRRELGSARTSPPVGVQFMGVDPGPVAQSAVNAAAAGAPMVDLNFGCPAKPVMKRCAGSALLDHPEKMHDLVSACVKASPVPVTAKVRIGVRDDSRLAEIVRAVEEAGAAMLTVHARTRADGYTHPARWEQLARVRSLTRLPLIGNGDVQSPEDAVRMARETGVDGVMVGRGVLRDPWIFGRFSARHRGSPEPRGDREATLRLLLCYADAMAADGAGPRVLGQLKQWVKRLDVGLDLGEPRRSEILRTPTLEEFCSRLVALPARTSAYPINRS